MLTRKISGTAIWHLFWVAASIAVLTACGPPGPRALIKGERLIREGKYAEAVEPLQRATQLMPKNAQAWNHLGLAYHGNNQPMQAVRAYKQAVTLDNKLAAARFNLGCVYLDQNELPSAIEQLTSYTYVQPNAPEGWLKLGAAQFRANRADLAERNFKAALEIQPNNIEALNGLGLIQFQKRKYLDALHIFQSALAQNPKYGPALLNAAIAAHAIPANRQMALQLYRQYLALRPPPEDVERITLVANQLDAELNPRPVVAAAPPGKTNLVAAATRTNQVQWITNTAPDTNMVVMLRTNQPLTPPRIAAATNPDAAPVPATNPTPAAASGPVELTRVENGLVIKPPQDLGTAPDPAASTTAVAPVASTPMDAAADPAAPNNLELSTRRKKGFFSRLFSGKEKPPATPITAVPPSVSPVVVNQEGYQASSGQTPIVIRRYTYLSPPRPAPGNRPAAQQFDAAGVRAHESGRLSEAVANYKEAIRADPSFTKAHYDLALASFDSANWGECLGACEYALVLEPSDANARLCFAKALRKARFPQDSAEQLETILQRHPQDNRARLMLAALYADELHQPKVAREHYLKVLQLEPAHREAAAIRYWLAANPG